MLKMTLKSTVLAALIPALTAVNAQSAAAAPADACDSGAGSAAICDPSAGAAPGALEPGLVLGTRHQMTPVLRPGADRPSPATAQAAQLQYYGGPVISSVKVYTLFWSKQVVGRHELNLFYRGITQSPYMDWLTEYNTPTQRIGRGKLAGSLVYTQQPTGNDIQDSEIQNKLAALIHAKHLPKNDGNMLIAVHLPPGVTVHMGGSVSCQDFCGYHGTFTLDGVMTYYAVLPDHGGPCASGCSAQEPDVIAQTTVTASHELVEAVTNPGVGLATDMAAPLAWYDNTNGEIGDICAGQDAQVGPHHVQLLWSNANNACIAQ
jgi:hypothetical protein